VIADRRTSVVGTMSQKLSCLTFCLVLSAISICLPVGSVGVISRTRRAAVGTTRVYVVPLSDSGDLFTVGSVPPGVSDSFQFVGIDPPGLVLDTPGLMLNASTGMISKVPSARWDMPSTVNFQVTYTTAAAPGMEC